MDKYTKSALEVFGKSISIAIDERGISISELSRLTELSRTTIYTIKNATDTYSIESYIKLAIVLQLHIEFSLMSPDNNVHTMISGSLNKN